MKTWKCSFCLETKSGKRVESIPHGKATICFFCIDKAKQALLNSKPEDNVIYVQFPKTELKVK